MGWFVKSQILFDSPWDDLGSWGSCRVIRGILLEVADLVNQFTQSFGKQLFANHFLPFQGFLESRAFLNALATGTTLSLPLEIGSDINTMSDLLKTEVTPLCMAS